MLPQVSQINTKKGLKAWFQRQQYNKHISRVMESKSVVSSDNIGYRKILPKCRRKYSTERRRKEINHENKRLLRSLTGIITKNGSVTSANIERKKQSLNGRKRMKELVKITMENLAFLKRLDSMKSSYDSKKFMQTFTERRHKNQEDNFNLINLPRVKTNDKLSPIVEKPDLNIMSKCNISNKKLRRFGDSCYFVGIEINKGILNILAHPTKGDKVATANFSMEECNLYSN